MSHIWLEDIIACRKIQAQCPGDSNAIREVETFKKNGFVGMKFHSPQKNYDDPSYFQMDWSSRRSFVGPVD